MARPAEPVTLSPEQVEELMKKLSTLRHNVNNHLALIVAASELISRKPDMAARLVENIRQQPDRIISEMRSFSQELENSLGILRSDPGTSPPV